MGEAIHNREPGEPGLSVQSAPDGRRTDCHALHVSLQATGGRGAGINAYTENPDAPVIRAQGPGPLIQGYDASGALVFEVDQTGITVGGGSSGGGAAPSDTVTAETTYGLDADAGQSDEYARGDHTHGTPALPSAADIGAAEAGHDHSGVYDPAGTAAATLAAHEQDADPHPGYLTTVEADAAYAALSHQHAGDDITSGTVAYDRLPVGTTSSTVAAGDDSRITGAVQASTVDAKGDLLAATAADTVGRVAVGADGQALVAQSSATAGLAYVAPSVFQVFPLTHYGLAAASGDPVDFLGTSVAANGQVFLARVWIPAGVTITNLWVAVRAAGTHDGETSPSMLGLYDDEGTQIDTTADDNTLFASAGWRGGPLQGGPVAAQPTGRWVYVGHIGRGWSGVALAFPASADDNQAAWFAVGPDGGRRRAMYQTSQTALPASFDPTSHGTATTFMPLYGVS